MDRSKISQFMDNRVANRAALGKFMKNRSNMPTQVITVFEPNANGVLYTHETINTNPNASVNKNIRVQTVPTKVKKPKNPPRVIENEYKFVDELGEFNYAELKFMLIKAFGKNRKSYKWKAFNRSLIFKDWIDVEIN